MHLHTVSSSFFFHGASACFGPWPPWSFTSYLLCSCCLPVPYLEHPSIYVKAFPQAFLLINLPHENHPSLLCGQPTVVPSGIERWPVSQHHTICRPPRLSNSAHPICLHGSECFLEDFPFKRVSHINVFLGNSLCFTTLEDNAAGECFVKHNSDSGSCHDTTFIY
jgi:hypothetical protein